MFKITSTKRGDLEAASSHEAAEHVFGGSAILPQVVIGWASRFSAMKVGESKELRDGLDNLTVVQRIA